MHNDKRHMANAYKKIQLVWNYKLIANQQKSGIKWNSPYFSELSLQLETITDNDTLTDV
jgi:hypothetical protein